MNLSFRIGFGWVHNRAGKIILTWLVPSYLLVGSYAVRSATDLFKHHESTISGQVPDDPAGSNDQSSQPFWTSHKHMISDDRFKTDGAGWAVETRFESDITTFPNFFPLAIPVPSAHDIDHSVGRAPPLPLVFA